MALCNCGCGAKIGFGQRGMNKNIQRTQDLLAKLDRAREDALRFKPYPDSDPNGMRTMVDDLVARGEHYRVVWVDATHGDHTKIASEALELKRGWNQWTRSVFSITGILAASPEEQRHFLEYMRARE